MVTVVIEDSSSELDMVDNEAVSSLDDIDEADDQEDSITETPEVIEATETSEDVEEVEDDIREESTETSKEEEASFTNDEKVDNLMVIVDSWSGKRTSKKFREEIVNYLDLEPYDEKDFESYEFGFISTVVWGLNDNPDKILIMSNFDVRVYENYDFILNKDDYSKVKRIGRYTEDSILYNDYNYEAYGIQDIDTGEVKLISIDDYELELQNKDEGFRKIY